LSVIKKIFFKVTHVEEREREGDTMV